MAVLKVVNASMENINRLKHLQKMTKTTEENLSQSKYAEHRKVTKGYIGRLVKEGRLHLIKGKLNVAMSDAELDNKSNDDKAPNDWREKALHEKAKREQTHSHLQPYPLAILKTQLGSSVSLF